LVIGLLAADDNTSSVLSDLAAMRCVKQQNNTTGGGSGVGSVII
jgi:hypothetical protein